MKLAGDLKHLRGLVRLLHWGVPDGLTAPALGYKAVGYLLRDVVDQWPAIDIGVGVEEAFFHALLDDLPDGGLWQSPKVDLSWVLLGNPSSLNKLGLHLQLDGAVVGYLVKRVGHDGIGDGEVPGLQLVTLVAIPMDLGPLSEGWGEADYRQEGVDRKSVV